MMCFSDCCWESHHHQLHRQVVSIAAAAQSAQSSQYSDIIISEQKIIAQNPRRQNFANVYETKPSSLRSDRERVGKDVACHQQISRVKAQPTLICKTERRGDCERFS